jgi:hypothetical protein
VKIPLNSGTTMSVPLLTTIRDERRRAVGSTRLETFSRVAVRYRHNPLPKHRRVEW